MLPVMNKVNIVILFSFLFTCLCFTSFSQNYPSIFGSQSTKWDFPWCNLDQSSITEQLSEIDTTINGVSYKKVGTIYPGGISYDLNTVNSNGYAREDQTEGKVWFTGGVESIFGIDTVEYLIMDLSLNVGDTFIIHESFGLELMTTIDSVYYDFGVKHVRTDHQFWASEVPLTFIEGLGTNYGISYMHDSYNMCRCLMSIKKDSDVVYSNSDCVLPVVGINEYEIENKFTFFPNPATSHIMIQKNTSDDVSYTIYSVLGKMIKTGMVHSNEKRVDVSDLPGSVYILVIGGQSYKLFLSQ